MTVQATSALLSAANAAASGAADGSKNAAFCAAIASGIGSGYKIVARRDGVVVLSMTMDGSMSSSSSGLAIPNSYASLDTLLAADIDSGTWTLRIEKASDPTVYVEGTLGRTGEDFALNGDLDPSTGLTINGLFLASPQLDTVAGLAATYVDTMVADMGLFHDGPSDVLEQLQGWGSGANYPTSFKLPSSWTAPYGIMWFHVMEDSENISAGDLARPWRVPGPYTGNQAPNTRIQMRDLQLWYLSMSDVWTLAAHREAPGSTMYPNNWNEGVDISNTTLRSESGNGGGASVRDIGRGTYESHNWHSFTGAAALPPNKGLATAVIGRKILDNTSGADDRASCRMLAAACGDWYRDASVVSGPKIMGQNTTVMGIARLKYLTNDWQIFAWYSNDKLGEAAIRANPPPFIGL